MLEYGDIAIKDPEDIITAIVEEDMPKSDFIWFFEAMENRWGKKDALEMVFTAICIALERDMGE